MYMSEDVIDGSHFLNHPEQVDTANARPPICKIAMSQWRAVSHDNVNPRRNFVPYSSQRKSTWEIEPPVAELGLPGRTPDSKSFYRYFFIL
mmetsp:Transcript_1398/g.3079  ORF Transcript_1398/g.3079 Transcript_1398/m.3079 type:complete len:91 (+) Transcript_1398:226-498(+)